MSAPELIRLIADHKLHFFTTADIITLSGMEPPAATHALSRLAAKNVLIRIKRGVWANRLIENSNPLEAVPLLSSPWPSYVSLYSALASHGKVEEIPHVIYAVSAGLAKQYKTPVGEFHFYQLPKRLIWGYDVKRSGHGSYPIAEPEKALLDLAYLALSSRSSLDFPYKRNGRWALDMDKLKKYALRFESKLLIDSLKKNQLWP